MPTLYPNTLVHAFSLCFAECILSHCRPTEASKLLCLSQTGMQYCDPHSAWLPLCNSLPVKCPRPLPSLLLLRHQRLTTRAYFCRSCHTLLMPVRQSGGGYCKKADLYVDLVAVPDVPFVVHPERPGRIAVPTSHNAVAVPPTKIIDNIRTLRRIRHLRAFLRAKASTLHI